MDLITDLTNISVSIMHQITLNHYFLEICNNSNCKSYIFSDTNIDLLKQNNDVNEYNMHILSSSFFPLNFSASQFVNIQSFVLLDHIITNDNPKDAFS